MDMTVKDIIEYRNSIPEPSRVKSEIWLCAIRTKHLVQQSMFSERHPELIPIKRLIFKKVLVVESRELSYYAWKCEEDGNIYL